MDSILIRKRPPKQKVNDFLIKYSKNVTSQSGEDGILEEIFRLIDDFDNRNSKPGIKTQPRWCAEFGCWDGKHLCNTSNLILNHGFHGILIEADSEKYKQLIQNYKSQIESKQVIALHTMIGFNDQSHCSCHVLYPNRYKISARTAPSNKDIKDFDQIVDSLNICIKDNTLDLIVIDVDGVDYHILDAMTKYKAKVLIIEFNPTIPNNIIYIQSRDMNVQCGSSLLAIIELAKHKNYELVCTTTYNAVFVDTHYYQNVFKHRMPTEDNSIYKMHDVPMETQIFQLYDGSLKIAGCKKLLWHKIKINEDKLQIIPKKNRHFPFAPNIDNKRDSNAVRKNTPKYVKKRKRNKTKHVIHAMTASAMVLKAVTFVSVGFCLGRIYERRQNNK